eukprot:m.308145 g.308145  ORF g.308145 m.308145 type:complete len:260 (+) comp43448_c0_seq1:420-1199(+)
MTTKRIVMWSTPRSVSTALERSFRSRDDAIAFDEPFCKYFLLSGGHRYDHAGDSDDKVFQSDRLGEYDEIVRFVTASPLPEEKSVIFFKSPVCDQLPKDVKDPSRMSWIKNVCNCFLTRDPAWVIASFGKFLTTIESPVDVGYPQQVDIFNRVVELTGITPPVIDAADLLAHPRETLEELCKTVGIPFQERMLSWEGGPHKEDFPGSAPWFTTVNKSTGFEPARPRGELSPELQAVAENCMPMYEFLRKHRIIPKIAKS